MSSPNERELEAYALRLARYRALAAPAALRARLRGELLAAPLATERRTGASRLAFLRPLLAATLVLAVIVAAGGSAAASSLPGDPAFAVKRTVEDVQVALAPSDDARLDALVAQADRRLEDLEAVALRRPGAIAVALDEYVAALARLERALAVTAGGPATPARDAALARAAALSAVHLARLQDLAERLPAPAQQGIERAVDAQQRIRAPEGPRVPGPSEPSVRPSVPGGVPGGRPSILPNRTASPPVNPGRP